MELLPLLQSLYQSGKKGYKTGTEIQEGLIKKTPDSKETGFVPGRYGQSVLGPGFKKELSEQNITLRQTPMEFLGAYASRAIVDVANDGTRTHYWRYNHPAAIAQRVSDIALDAAGLPQGIVGRSAISLGIAAPAIASAGTFDITNPGELFRQKGYAQTYAEEGSEDRRETSQPAQELFERFFLGRTGRPLKYDTAKEDIPDLTPGRYGEYMDYLYNDKGLLGIGIVKGTMENLQGVPEVRIAGFPFSLPGAGGFAAGTTGAIVAANTVKRASSNVIKPAERRSIAKRGTLGGVVGSALGVAVGNVMNEQIASANRQRLPTLQNYTEQGNI